MTDKEFLLWIYNRMLYKHGEDMCLDYMRRFRNIIDSLQEEPEFSKEEQIIHDGYLNKIRKKRVIPELKGEVKHKFINEFNTMYQTLQMGMFERCMRDPMMEVCLDFAAWGAFHLKGYYSISDEEKVKMDSMQEEPVSEDLEEEIQKHLKECLNVKFPTTDIESIKKDVEYTARHFAQWQKQQMMLKAIDGVVTFDYYDSGDKTYGCVAHDSFCLEDFSLKDRDKVKVIVIKED